MKTAAELLTEMAASLKELARVLLLQHTRLEEDKDDPHSPIIVIRSGSHWWQPLGTEGSRLRSKLREEYQRFHALMACLLHKQPSAVQQSVTDTSRQIKEVVDQEGSTWVKSTSEAYQRFEEAIETQLHLLTALYDGSEGEHVFVPDTNALLYNPHLEDWRFQGSRRFTLLLMPTVLSELDQLKVTGRNESVREKAQGLIRRLMEYRRRGDLNEGVVLRRDSHRLRTLAVEPDFRHSLPWLDPDNQDDRILAGFVEVMRQHPRCPAALVTGDINLANKADYARVPCVEPPELPKSGDEQRDS